jgi:transcription elongation factor Elf1
MESFLICVNLQCHFLLDCGEGSQEEHPSFHHVRTCPKCGRLLSSHCPFCLQVLQVTWRREVPHCAQCGRELRSQTI